MPPRTNSRALYAPAAHEYLLLFPYMCKCCFRCLCCLCNLVVYVTFVIYKNYVKLTYKLCAKMGIVAKKKRGYPNIHKDILFIGNAFLHTGLTMIVCGFPIRWHPPIVCETQCNALLSNRNCYLLHSYLQRIVSQLIFGREE